MSVLGLKSRYTVKYGLSPRAAPSGNPLGSGLILPYISPLVLIRIQSDLAGSNALEVVGSKVPEIISLRGELENTDEITDGTDKQSLYPRKAEDLQHYLSSYIDKFY